MLDVLTDLGAAEIQIRKAYGDKEGAARRQAQMDKLAESGKISGEMENTQQSSDELKALAAEKKDLSDEAKKELAKAIPPYLKAVYKTSQLSGPMKDFSAEARQTLAQAAVNPLKLRKLQKTLSTGMSIAKNGPGLIKSLTSNAKDLVTFSKEAGVVVKEDKAYDSF